LARELPRRLIQTCHWLHRTQLSTTQKQPKVIFISVFSTKSLKECPHSSHVNKLSKAEDDPYRVNPDNAT